jgi:hypothetical protein
MISVRYTRIYYQSPFQRHHYLNGSVLLEDIFKGDDMEKQPTTTPDDVVMEDTTSSHNDDNNKFHQMDEDDEDDKKPSPSSDDVMMEGTLFVNDGYDNQLTASLPQVPTLNDQSNLYIDQSFYYGDRVEGEPRQIYQIHEINDGNIVARGVAPEYLPEHFITLYDFEHVKNLIKARAKGF